MTVSQTQLFRLLDRGVKALEEIGRQLKKNNTIQTINVSAPANIDATKTRVQIPAFFMPPDRVVIDTDEAAANGFAVIDETGIHITLREEYYPDFIRGIVNRDDLEPIAVIIGLNYKPKTTDE